VKRIPARTAVLGLIAVATLVAALAVHGQFDNIGGLRVARPEDKQDVKSLPAPPGAKVLFDGTAESLKTNWEKQDGGGEPTWEIKAGGAMQIKGGSIVTREKYDEPILVHVEFRSPTEPPKDGDLHGNSGVYLQGRYEVQILDSYGVPDDKLRLADCGSIYDVALPKHNVSKAPTVWQSFDIEFHPPIFDGSGKRIEPAWMTVSQNGAKIHDKQAITVDNTTAGMGGDPKSPGPIMLQDHGDVVQFRNVWVMRLAQKKS
jgi:hypothetical protein